MRDMKTRSAIFAAGVAAGFVLSILFHSPKPNPTPEMPTADREPNALTKEPSNFLSSPRFKADGVIRSTLAGYIHVRWTEVAGAEKYSVTVLDGEGNHVRTFETTRSFTFLRNLKVNPKLRETPYTVRVTPIGQDSQKGTPSEWKKIAMLAMKDLAPPTIKSITTED